MATHVQHEISNPARLIPTKRWRIPSVPVDAARTAPTVVGSQLDFDAPQHHPEQLSFLESARMEREWHEKCLRVPNIGVRSRQYRSRVH